MIFVDDADVREYLLLTRFDCQPKIGYKAERWKTPFHYKTFELCPAYREIHIKKSTMKRRTTATAKMRLKISQAVVRVTMQRVV